MRLRSFLLLSFVFTILTGPVLVFAAESKILTVMTHDSFNVSKEVISSFERQHQVSVRFLKTGDAGAALIQAILSKDTPMADLFYGVDNTFLSRALAAGLFLPYASPLLTHVPQELQLDPQHRLLPVDYGDVCINYDKKWFTEKKLAPPRDLADLILPDYRNLTVVQNPATSSPGLAFLLATIARFGETGYLEFWQKLRANGVLIANGWNDAYFGHFTAASKGDRPIVVSYASSPPAAVYYAEKPVAEAPTAAVVSDNNAFRQIEFVGILQGTKNLALAQQFVDFMLGKAFQEDIPLQMFVFPANAQAELPDIFRKYAAVAKKPAVISPELIERNRERWIDDWTTTMLR